MIYRDKAAGPVMRLVVLVSWHLSTAQYLDLPYQSPDLEMQSHDGINPHSYHGKFEIWPEIDKRIMPAVLRVSVDSSLANSIFFGFSLCKWRLGSELANIYSSIINKQALCPASTGRSANSTNHREALDQRLP